MALKPNDLSFLHLVMRSPDQGEGWRKVSKACWPLIEKFGHPELIEAEPTPEGGGRMRLSERGAAVVDYV